MSLGRSQQQGKTRIKVRQMVVQFWPWQEAVPVAGGGAGDLVLLWLAGCLQPGLAQEVISGTMRRTRWNGVRRGVVGGPTARPLSQSGL